MPKEKMTLSSGNVFEDLGFKNAKIMKYKAELVIQLAKIIRQKKLTQMEAASKLGIAQSKLSAILSGRVSLTLDKLITYLDTLGCEIEFKAKIVKTAPKSKPPKPSHKNTPVRKRVAQ